VSRRARVLTTVAVIVVIVGAVSVAVAVTNPVHGTGTIWGCFDKKAGNLRVVNPKTACLSNEQSQKWSQTGPPGASRAPGATGAPDATGAPGVPGSNGAPGPVGVNAYELY
jgi:hypothetical protein